ncbi:MAG: hypothetical protein IPM51_08695 [Sphingobacteriaceae bacterium]|nr:hypothetical protein [Sphingobacteriaceae bacterium]
MKRFLAPLLLVGFLIQNGSQVSILIKFYLNQEYIANNLCENREKPELGCEGKCCLAEELEEDVTSKEEQKAPNLKEEGIQLLNHESNYIVFKNISLPCLEYLDMASSKTLIGFSTSIFLPPEKV